jgi:transcriptional regulator with XRE-family HTH domain
MCPGRAFVDIQKGATAVKPKDKSAEVDVGSETEATLPAESRGDRASSAVSEQVTKFGDKLKQARNQLNYTQEELAIRLQVKRQTLASWESGATTPDIQTLLRLREIARCEKSVGINLGDLLGEPERLDAGPTPLAFARRFLERMDVLGVRNAYPNRSDALNGFYLALEREKEMITIVCSSLFGVLRASPQRVSGLLKKKAQSGVELRILMTDKGLGGGREAQENRPRGSIVGEIEEAIQLVTGSFVTGGWGIPRSSIRLYQGAPTVFLMFTGDRMLLNPYTYGAEAYKTLTLEVAPTGNHEDIFTQYSKNHFESAWGGPLALKIGEGQADAEGQKP